MVAASKLLAAFATGVPFGLAMEKAKISASVTLADQMAFQNFTMMRMFLAACGTSVVTTYLVHKSGAGKRKINEPLSCVPIGSFGSNVVGGMLLGAGIHMSGSCPGSVWVQIGARLPGAGLVVAGGVAGAAAFSYFEAWMRKKSSKFGKKAAPLAIDEQLGVPYGAMAAAFAVAMAGCVVAIDALRPWGSELAKIVAPGTTVSTYPSLSAGAWDPATAGVVVGLMQLPAFIFQGQGLGSSSGYVAAAGAAAGAVDKNRDKHAPYFKSAGKGWQLAMGAGMAAGSLLSVSMSGAKLAASAAGGLAASPIRAAVGGFLMLFGARQAGGCTSGHGLTGMAALSTSSVVTVASMFAGGGLSALAHAKL
mmetsp:Transcript_46541/g.149396  ORF Transcript_46541/g.149396 Transcript_46541/m.149396 type:complete len:364 (-) Transcript_46541:1486-2577(-)